MISEERKKSVQGRGTATNPQSRFDAHSVEYADGEGAAEGPACNSQILADETGNILTSNDSPDVGFGLSLNPYRGCEHGCSYCFARPNHEYLELSAGLDFETKIFAKHRAPELLRKRLCSSRWQPQTIALSGSTDPYQPAERELGITRRCLAALAEARNPVAVITKSHLVTRDIDLLSELSQHSAVSVALSITTLIPELARKLEPRASSPQKRLETIRQLSRAGIPCRVLVAPVIPGLTDEEVPAILKAAAEAGASHAGYIAIRLPHGVKDLFADWLERHAPLRKQRVLSRIRSLRGGKLYDADYTHRLAGTGPYAELLARTFATFSRQSGLSADSMTLSTSAFAPPTAQKRLFYIKKD